MNLGSGGRRSASLSSASWDSSTGRVGAISNGAGGGSAGSSSPNEGRGGETSSSVFSDMSSSASKGAGVNLGSGGRRSASFSSVSWGSSTGRGGAISKVQREEVQVHHHQMRARRVSAYLPLSLFQSRQHCRKNYHCP